MIGKVNGLWSSHIDTEYENNFGQKPPWPFAEMASLCSDVVSMER